MNKFVYFMAVGLAYTALQVATVAAQDPAVMEARMAEDAARDAARQAEDEATQAARQAEDDATMAASMAEDEAAMAASGTPGTDPCMDITPQEDQDACYAASPTGGQHDCSEIPDAAGRALCETAEARGTPPTAAECALVGDPAECLRHAAGGGDGPPPGAMCTNPAGGPMIPCPAP